MAHLPTFCYSWLVLLTFSLPLLLSREGLSKFNTYFPDVAPYLERAHGTQKAKVNAFKLTTANFTG
nr:MAG TPA: hypothetical protein [Caudoviricetes sp.]